MIFFASWDFCLASSHGDDRESKQLQKKVNARTFWEYTTSVEIDKTMDTNNDGMKVVKKHVYVHIYVLRIMIILQ